MGVYIKRKLPTEFNGITMEEAVELADMYLQDNPCDRMWDAIRALRDFCECINDEATKIEIPHGRLVEFIDVVTYEEDGKVEVINFGEAYKAYCMMRAAKPVIEAEGE